jgi:uncharacterized protein (TIGR02145 family)
MSGIPASPVAGTHTSTTSAITWNWNSVAGALGYKWNTTNDYSTATDMGTALTKTESGLTCATTYTRYVWAYTACGVSTPVTLTKATIYCLWICGMPLTDSRDGKIYSTVFIGTQCWMAENLNVGVQLATFIPCSNNGMIEKYCFSGLPSNCTEYGGLYVWDEMMNYTTSSNTNPSNRQGVCPTGWHIPSDAEWCEMESFLDANVVCPETGWIGVDVGGQLKEAGTVHWTTPNTGATNASGFTALPGGYTWDNNSGNGYKGTKAYFSSATEISTTLLSGRGLHYDSKQSTQLDLDKTFGLSVRCVKN